MKIEIVITGDPEFSELFDMGVGPEQLVSGNLDNIKTSGDFYDFLHTIDIKSVKVKINDEIINEG